MKYENKFYYIGLFVILLGIVFNPWFIEKFVPDGELEGLSYIIPILIIQILLILFGMYLSVDKTLLKRAIVILSVLLIFFLPLTIIDSITFLKSVRSNIEDQERQTAQIMLDQVIFLDKNKVAELSQETGEILYSPHQNTSSLTFKIPEGGVLDTAIGIDPLILNQFTGNIYFELSIALKDGRTRTVFKTDIDLSSLSEKDLIWQKVSVNLSEYSGRVITINFSKGYNSDSQKKPKVVYDLLPIDFMYWRIPSVRPKKLEDKYNVILISLDTLRADHLHFMGYPRKTSPNLDRLAQNGVFFTTVVSQAPWTTPSHFSIFTSMYPSVHQGNQPIQILNRHWNDTLPTMASILRDKGHVTAAFTGKGSISAQFGFYKGFDFYNETTSFGGSGCIGDAESIFNKSLQWLKNNKERTFFLFIHTYEAHSPYCDEFFVNRERVNKSDTIKYRTALYDGDIRRADLFIGKLIERLDELDLTDNTILVITSDHGEHLGGRNPPRSRHFGHGFNLYDELLLVPLVFYNKKLFPQGKGIDYQVRLIDILPTVLEYLGYKERIEFQGESLKGMIDGYDRLSRPAYSEATTYGTERESIRDNGYKYIYRISYGQLSNSESLGLPLTPLHELYDLNVDPGEKLDIAQRRGDLVEKYQKLILSIFPKKGFRKPEKDLTTRSVDITKDKELVENLKSLGYIE